MRKFDTSVQELKYKVIKELCKASFEDRLESCYYDIPKTIVPGPKATMRCCIYKERAIVEERIRLAMGKGKTDNVIEVIDIACDECPVERFRVTESCRGCISHRCMDNCPVKAIEIVDHHARINKEKCIECGRCMKSCPYSAIIENIRPCRKSCKAGAISISKEDKKAIIDYNKCVSCGSCVYQCPFGAIVDKSYVLNVVEALKESKKGGKKVYAIIAPAIVSQFHYANIEQIVAGIKKIGFQDVVEVALGADLTAYKDAEELLVKKMLTSSCCPAFVAYIEKQFPDLAKYISHNVSPMVETARIIKERHENAYVVFIGPCTAKKEEFKLEKTKGLVDCVITFEELQALLDSKDIEVEKLEGEALDNASYYGRIFARSGGVTEAVKYVASKIDPNAEVNPVIANGLTECKVALLKLAKGILKENFIEGMACEGGCINGAGCLTHTPKNAAQVDAYANQAKEKDMSMSVQLFMDKE